MRNYLKRARPFNPEIWVRKMKRLGNKFYFWAPGTHGFNIGYPDYKRTPSEKHDELKLYYWLAHGDRSANWEAVGKYLRENPEEFSVPPFLSDAA